MKFSSVHEKKNTTTNPTNGQEIPLMHLVGGGALNARYAHTESCDR